jgi:hypothetical protein
MSAIRCCLREWRHRCVIARSIVLGSLRPGIGVVFLSGRRQEVLEDAPSVCPWVLGWGDICVGIHTA